VLLVLALGLAATLYAPTLDRGIVNYEDPWLYRDNFVVQDASLASVRTIFCDLDVTSPARYALAPEYLPIRDLSVMLDFAVWGSWYPGFHLTNLVLYLASIALLYAMLDAFGVDRTIVGLAVLVWAIHPAHAESVAWLSERKGLLGVVFACAAGLGYARFRAGRSALWLVGAALATVAAVWSKAPAAFAIAALAGLEVVLPARRVSWRRSLIGLGTLALVGSAAFAPVVMMASNAEVIGGSSAVPGNRLATVLGIHGFYLELGAMGLRNAVSYPIAKGGPSVFQIVLGALGLVAVVAALAPRLGRFRPPPPLRAAAVLWLFGWLPVSHLVLPLHMVAIADRYALFATIGVALAIAVGVRQLGPRLQIFVGGAVVAIGCARTFDAQARWGSTLALWERAVDVSPDDGKAWSMYAEALSEAGEPELAEAAVEEGLTHTRAPRLLLRRALLLLDAGRRAEALPLFETAAKAGEPIAMSNFALLELEGGHFASALGWARRGAEAAPRSAHAHRTHGKVALASKQFAEAHAAFQTAYAIEPQPTNRYNLALALLALHRPAEAVPHLEACLGDRGLAQAARVALAEAHRQLATPQP
jgi:hypothetical protein